MRRGRGGGYQIREMRRGKVRRVRYSIVMICGPGVEIESMPRVGLQIV